jgi:uncharacterized protein YabE (DUF348 family)
MALSLASLLTGSGLVGVGTELTFGKDITIIEDGVTTQASVIHASVAEVLVKQGITLDSHDRVTPGLATTVTPDTVISVRHGRRIDLTMDGTTGLYWSTATTVADLVNQLGLDPLTIRLSTDLTARIPRSGIDLEIERGNDVDLTADGATQPLHAFGTVADALATAGLTWDPDDLVDPHPDTSLARVTAITLVRVEVATSEREVELPFATTYEDDASLYEGQTQVKSPGVPGATRQTVVQTYHDGQLVLEEIAAEAPLRAPVTQVSVRGTKARPVGAAPAGVWAALAQCESGGNPSTNTGNGYYGMYQFSLGTWRSLGGTGLPSEASAEEQTMRAQALQAKAGWGQWPGCARRLGLL